MTLSLITSIAHFKISCLGPNGFLHETLQVLKISYFWTISYWIFVKMHITTNKWRVYYKFSINSILCIEIYLSDEYINNHHIYQKFCVHTYVVLFMYLSVYLLSISLSTYVYILLSTSTQSLTELLFQYLYVNKNFYFFTFTVSIFDLSLAFKIVLCHFAT